VRRHRTKEQMQKRRRMRAALDHPGAKANAAGETTGQREAEERDRKQEIDG